MHKNAQICMLQFKIFPGAMRRTPMLVRGYSAPPEISLPQHSGAACLPRLARGLNLPPPECLLAIDATEEGKFLTSLKVIRLAAACGRRRRLSEMANSSELQ